VLSDSESTVHSESEARLAFARRLHTLSSSKKTLEDGLEFGWLATE
jgi:hypothetical protein